MRVYRRSFRRDLNWLLDNALKKGESLTIPRGSVVVDRAVFLYRKERKAPVCSFKVRPLTDSSTSVTKLKTGYERKGP